MPDILSLSKDEVISALSAMGEPAYRAKQVFDWLYVKKVSSCEGMSSLSKALRDKLAVQYPFPVLTEKIAQESKDGTRKFLFALDDGERIETVFIPTEKRATLCISSQAGCKFGCTFCASGLGGWKRNLTPGEILGQVLHVMRAVRPTPVTHIVFMGVGEPFDNYDNVLKAVRLLNDKDGLNIAARRITISTCGIIPGIERMASEGLQVELSVSLHAASEAMRARLMPVNKKYPLKDLLRACRKYAETTNRQVTFEYILIKGLTCTPQAIDELSTLMRGWLSKVNLIPCNPVKEFAYYPPDTCAVEEFQKALERNGVICTLRSARGQDISAACGQLRHERHA
ncbi:MAG: 23S rRNA (adenine(2503)-C(2))-methyltransferase RlmN [Candidatus Omnitrophica bacterium]|nr:23S rRNA (adenine(2503)-C(2))-methyltransferase RlmN [Candidatus Omnitrophota bacterium]